jgi:hypothetical protein
MKSHWKSYLKKTVSIGLIIVVLLPALWCVFSVGGLLLSWHPFIPWSSKQKRLAGELCVNINDYPYPMYFPLGYYETKLRSGTDVSDVHKTIRGYRTVFNCYDREVYYYFSSDKYYSLRLEVWYNDDLTVAKINGEDEDSRTIFIDGCTEGQMAE